MKLPRKKRIKLKDGDVFRFKVDNDSWGYGHIIVGGKLQYIVIFEPIFKTLSPIEAVLESKILLAGWTSDALAYHGRWEAIGNYPKEHNLKYPEFKVGIGGLGEMWVVDFLGNQLRRANKTEIENLDYQSSSSPITYQRAFLAYQELIEHKPYYDELYYLGYKPK